MSGSVVGGAMGSVEAAANPPPRPKRTRAITPRLDEVRHEALIEFADECGVSMQRVVVAAIDYVLEFGEPSEVKRGFIVRGDTLSFLDEEGRRVGPPLTTEYQSNLLQPSGRDSVEA